MDMKVDFDAELSILEDDQVGEIEIPNPSEPSMILFRTLDEGRTHNGQPETTVDVYAYEGGAADYEQNYGPGLEYILSSMVDHIEGFWIMESFVVYYHTDYYGEVDGDYDYETIRKALPSDWEHFGCSPEDGNYLLDHEKF